MFARRLFFLFSLRRARPAAAVMLAAVLAGPGALPVRAADEDPFPRARARGELIVGVPYLAAPAAAGAKIRTPERLDAALAQRLGERLGLPARLVQVAPATRTQALAQGDVDVVLADRVDPQSVAGLEAPGVAGVATGYATRPKAVIRSDTPLRRWRDLAGRSVCLSAAAVQAQALAVHWGARVHTFRVPSDALVAVREGTCDVGLIDDAVWAPLMTYPEWRKFSATLPLEGPRVATVWLVPQTGLAAAWLDAAMRDWRREGVWTRLTAKWAREVAFDVYLDQEVPDCHG